MCRTGAGAVGTPFAALSVEVLDWKQLLIGKNDWTFLMSVALRSAFMFLNILLGLRVLGKRESTSSRSSS